MNFAFVFSDLLENGLDRFRAWKRGAAHEAALNASGASGASRGAYLPASALVLSSPPQVGRMLVWVGGGEG